MNEAFAHSCQYKRTYSIIIVAEDSYQARSLFIAWLMEAKGESVDLAYVKVKRIKTDHRPIFIA